MSYKLLETLCKGKLFAQFDLANGYFQIPLSKEAQKILGFVWDKSVFENSIWIGKCTIRISMFNEWSDASIKGQNSERVLRRLGSWSWSRRLERHVNEGRKSASMFAKGKFNIATSKVFISYWRNWILGIYHFEWWNQTRCGKTKAIAEYPEPVNIHFMKYEGF